MRDEKTCKACRKVTEVPYQWLNCKQTKLLKDIGRMDTNSWFNYILKRDTWDPKTHEIQRSKMKEWKKSMWIITRVAGMALLISDNRIQKVTRSRTYTSKRFNIPSR